MATWQKVQTDFVDAPADADISVDHPDIVENYRGAHAIYQSQHNGEINTEDARQAFVHYRALFDRLLGSDSDVEPNIQNGEHRRQTHDHA